MRIRIVSAAVRAGRRCWCTHAAAQINSGVITGIVTDPQKAVVPNAKVDVVEDATKFSYSVTTNGSGEFTVPYLKAGSYTVTVTAPGLSGVSRDRSDRRRRRHGRAPMFRCNSPRSRRKWKSRRPPTSCRPTPRWRTR